MKIFGFIYYYKTIDYVITRITQDRKNITISRYDEAAPFKGRRSMKVQRKFWKLIFYSFTKVNFVK